MYNTFSDKNRISLFSWCPNFPDVQTPISCSTCFVTRGKPNNLCIYDRQTGMEVWLWLLRNITKWYPHGAQSLCSMCWEEVSLHTWQLTLRCLLQASTGLPAPGVQQQELPRVVCVFRKKLSTKQMTDFSNIWPGEIKRTEMDLHSNYCRKISDSKLSKTHQVWRRFFTNHVTSLSFSGLN